MPAKKPFPLTTFSDALSFAQGISGLGADGPIKRLTLLDQLGKRPGSSKTRDLITHSATYGLTKGSSGAEFIELTADGKVAVDGSDNARQRRKHFDLAISRIGPFRKVFDRYKGKSMPKPAFLKDALEQVGVASDDTDQAIATLQQNLEFVGAITDVSGVTHIDMPSFGSQRSVDDGDPDGVGKGGTQGSNANRQPDDKGHDKSGLRPPTTGPHLHIDVQVHIDSNATPELIDQIFKSMATHLYGNGLD